MVSIAVNIQQKICPSLKMLSIGTPIYTEKKPVWPEYWKLKELEKWVLRLTFSPLPKKLYVQYFIISFPWVNMLNISQKLLFRIQNSSFGNLQDEYGVKSLEKHVSNLHNSF